MEEKTKEQLLDEKLQFTKKNVYEEATPEKLTSIFEYAEGYKTFLFTENDRKNLLAPKELWIRKSGTEQVLNQLKRILGEENVKIV